MLQKLALLFFIAIALNACTSSNEDNSADNSTSEKQVVNVYTQRHYESDEKLFEKFEGESGIEVKLVKASADQLLERIKMEGENSPADLLISVDASRLWRAKNEGVFQKITDTDILNLTDPLFFDKDSFWIGLTYRSRVFVINKDSVNNIDLLKTYDGITNSVFENELMIRSSENIYNQSLVAAIIAHRGEAAAEEWAEKIVANMARKPNGNDSDQLKNVAAGTGDVALVNTYYLARMMDSDNPEEIAIADKLKLVFPDQGSFGAHINISGIGLLKHSKNKANALKLIAFLLSKEAQEYFAEVNNEYPVNPNAEWPPVLNKIGTFQKDSLDLNQLGIYNSAAVRIMDRVAWQ